ncbi:hypothetical protein [Noviherbaspirillum saxi]|uniref:Uncharacterized protein n=1 Tax=Noviherbaspirillum saxi TaxID=2320863 RepID=A0A3A3FGQ3_9BURK|nr:hypothetical protein [Noviherbaspirillum saxi]RJF92576.1 hypothetical protein D3871_28700 [Noviherbaspirillum saxi]
MTTLTIGPSRSYTENVRRAAQDLIDALFAINKKTVAIKEKSAPARSSMSDAYADVLGFQDSAKTTRQRQRRARNSALIPYAHWSASWYSDKE